MRKTRIELLMGVVAVLALSAGIAGGLLASKLPKSSSHSTSEPIKASMGGPDRTPLTEELNLNADQREKMREIWEGVRIQLRGSFDEARSIERRREQALLSLLTDEQKAKFEKISQDLAVEFETLEQGRDKLFDEAVQKTKSLLSDEQKRIYEDLLRKRGPGAMGPREPGQAFGPGMPAADKKFGDLGGKNPTSGPSN